MTFTPFITSSSFGTAILNLAVSAWEFIFQTVFQGNMFLFGVAIALLSASIYFVLKRLHWI